MPVQTSLIMMYDVAVVYVCSCYYCKKKQHDFVMFANKTKRREGKCQKLLDNHTGRNLQMCEALRGVGCFILGVCRLPYLMIQSADDEQSSVSTLLLKWFLHLNQNRKLKR